MDQSNGEAASLENVIGIVTRINNLLRVNTSQSSLAGFTPELEAGIDLLRKSSELIRATEGSTIPMMETLLNVTVQAVPNLVQMLPAEKSIILNTTTPLLRMDVIDVNSVNISPKQQLKNIKHQQWKYDQQLRNAGLSLGQTMERTANSLLDILPDTKDYMKAFEKDDVTVAVARSTRKDIILQSRQVNVSAFPTHCNIEGGTDAKMIVMKKNLFSWNASTFGENVTTPVTMFSWGSQRFDHNCSVQLNLSHPIAIENIEDPRRQKRDLQERGLVGAQFALGGIVVGQNSNETMVLYAFDVPAVTAVVVMQLSWWDHAAAFRVFFRYDTPPTEQLYDDKMVVEEEDAVLAWRRGTNSVRKFVPNITKRRGRLYVGVQKAESDSLLQTALSPKDFVLQASAVSCLNWDHTFEKWQDVGCGVGVDPFDSTFRCNCDVPKPKAVIGGSLHALPNTIELEDIFKDPSILNDNNLVYYTVICEWALYLVLMIILNVDFQRFRVSTSSSYYAPSSSHYHFCS
ncbi:uncharacterized protein LOC118406516 [Branchiostoma floridae]|uniref:Uncharacterized protein LOC118406516 n=1 Tax=Branchiostoma floridae TaxID=7739 RepID=A0A9J7HMR8_BRAFL|nr:uncharacterized protein LOC118406516 [Branchiostoma floridae]